MTDNEHFLLALICALCFVNMLLNISMLENKK